MARHGQRRRHRSVTVSPPAGELPANEAARRNLHEALIILAQNNADLNLPNNKGQAPIHIAVAWDNIESVQVLIKYGARVNVLDNRATLPSMYACTKTKDILLEALHEQNTQPFAPTLKYGISPFKRALFFNSKNSPTEKKCEIESSNSQIIP